MPTLTIRDETTTGDIGQSIELEFLTDHITVRELIRSRVYQEVQDYNTRQPTHFRMLVQPNDAEQRLNGYEMKQPRQINWKHQYEMACEAFIANRILILIDNLQAESLEQRITLTQNTKATFLKLVPLVGG